MRNLWLMLAGLPLVWAAWAGGYVSATPAPPAATAVVLRIDGDVANPLSLAPADLAKLPRRAARAQDHHGPPATYEGVPLNEVLQLAGVPLGDRLRGPEMARYVVATGADGYRAVFALAELDPEFTDRLVLLADRKDGQPLPAAEGPLRLVAPDEKRPARWVRQLTTLTIGRAAAPAEQTGRNR